MSRREYTDVVIVGGGQAGISLSYYLHKRQIPHIILERDRPFSAWHNRWDGFKANTPNWMNTLPMLNSTVYPGNDAGGFATREELIAYLEDCLKVFNPPIRTDVDVRKIVEKLTGGWQVFANDAIYESANVAVCTGGMCTPRIPKEAADIPSTVNQIHSREFQNPNQIPTKSVLLVGSGSSGVQICRLLCESKKFENIHFSVSDVLILPERILGIPTHRFLHFFGLFDVKKKSWLGKLLYSSLETRGDPIMRPAPADLAKLHGIKLYGRFKGVDGSKLHFVDGKSLAADDLTIIWCTGFRGDYNFIETPQHHIAFDKTGYPNHHRGVIETVPGLYFVGLRYQHTVASHDIYGVGKDAKYIAEVIQKRRGG